VVLVELVVTPPSEGDRVDELIERLLLPRHSVEPAVAALELAGLAVREGHVARKRARALLRVPLAGDAVSDPRLAVLELLIDHHPGLLAVDEVIREMTSGAEAFAARDEIEVALRELIEAGLAHRLGTFVFASHAAARCHQLQQD